MNFPTLSDIQTLHKKYSPCQKAYDIVYSHSHIVWEIAEEIINNKRFQINKELVFAGALLHDIGAYRFIDKEGNFYNETHYIQHGVLGYEILKREQLPEELCRIASHHTGAGITAEQIQKRNLPLPLHNFLAENQEERLVMYADKFHSKTPKFWRYETYRQYIVRFGEENQSAFEKLADEFGIPDIAAMAKSYNTPIK